MTRFASHESLMPVISHPRSFDQLKMSFETLTAVSTDSMTSLSASRMIMIPCSIVPYPKAESSACLPGIRVALGAPGCPGSGGRVDMLGFSLLSDDMRLTDVVMATIRLVSGVMMKSVNCVVLNDHWRTICPAADCDEYIL